MRLWEFSCEHSENTKRWSTTLQYLISIDKKVLVLKWRDHNDSNSECPTKDILINHYKPNGNVLEVIYMESEKTFILIFDNETAVERLMAQNRLHIVSTFAPKVCFFRVIYYDQ